METNSVMDAAVRDLQALFDVGAVGILSDEQLLERFIARREGAVFEAVVRRHGPMVWGVCRRVLRDHHDAEDAFQATFLVLARKAASILPRRKLGNWLYGVAYQTSIKARAKRAKRRDREAQVSNAPEPMAASDDRLGELAESLDRELSRLPEKYRIPIVLCDLEGRDHREAANQLGWPVGTVSSRLSRARAMLAGRLSRRGLSLSAGSLALLLAEESASAGIPTWLIGHTAQAPRLFAAGGAATAGVVPAKVAALTGEVLKMMLLSKIKAITVTVLMASALVAAGAGLAYRVQGSESASREEAPSAKGPEQKGQAPRDDDPIAAKNRELEERPKTAEPPGPAPEGPEASPPPPPLPEEPLLPNEPQPPIPATGQAPHQEDPLAELIMTGDHTPEQLERAKAVIESMITLEKEVRGKSPEVIAEMIRDRASALEKARWEVRVMDAQLRWLKAIKQTTHGSAPDEPQP